MKSIFFRVIFAALFAFTLSSFIYFGFSNIYSSKILNIEAFSSQFHSGIYQYRILSGHFLMWIYNFLGSFNIDYSIFKFKFLNPASEPKMYLAFYILNTFFTVLSSIILVLITETKNIAATDSEKILMVTTVVSVICITQFSLSPYDCTSYFFILSFFLIFIRYYTHKENFLLLILAIILIISTLNRESSALSISLAITLLYNKYGIRRESIFPVFILVLFFLLTYFGIRIFNSGISTNDGPLLYENFSLPKNYLGILFWLVFFAFTLLLAKTKRNRSFILLFHFFSLPYIAMCFYTGILYEVRLYVPLFSTSLLLAFFDTEANKYFIP